MKFMSKVNILAAFSLLFAISVSAQDLDPTIEVSRAYEGKLIEVHKPSLEMAVPDTMHRFDLDFDYSVFDSPYKGSYEFSPYVLQMNPSSAPMSGKSFYLRAGAGYTLHPTLDLLWSPLKKEAFSMDIYASHDSYIGTYRAIGSAPEWKGYDMVSTAGADFGYDWKKAALEFGAAYYGVADKDIRRGRTYNAADIYAGLKSKLAWPGNWNYDLQFAYRVAADKSTLSPVSFNEHDFKADLCIKPDFRKIGKMFLNLGFEVDSYSHAGTRTVGGFYLVPHYVLTIGPLSVDAGLRLSVLMNTVRSQIVYPDVKVGLTVLPDAMKLYLNVGGGDKINTYASLLEGNSHLGMEYGLGGPLSVVDATVERVSAVLGLAGRITSFFSYDIRGGYVNYKSAPLYAVIEDSAAGYLPVLGYTSYQKCFVAFDWGLTLQDVRFDGTVEYTHAWGSHNPDMLIPAAVTGDVSAAYNWNRRVNAGLDCRFATARSAAGFRVPGYADLGVSAEYAMNKKIAFWIRGGNLLNMEIQRDILYAEKGISFTAGICLTF
jgi:hypothetical protein